MDPNTQRLLFGAAGAAGGDSKTYIEDLFSTYLYTGNGSSQTINNGIDLAGKGGMVWTKARGSAYNHELSCTDLATSYFGTQGGLRTNQDVKLVASDVTGYTSTGFTLGYLTGFGNFSGEKYVSWTFRKAAKFFDVVTWTGDGVATGRAIPHSLGTAPGFIIIKRTDTSSNWVAWHRGSASSQSYLYLNSTAASPQYAAGTVTDSYNPSPSTQFIVYGSQFLSGGAVTDVNANNGTYVAYLFAHDTTADGMIQCGSFTTDGSGNIGSVNLGWEAQWILLKRTDSPQDWQLWDTMRGMSLTSSKVLKPNSSGSEIDLTSTSYIYPTATGFAGSGNYFGPNAQVAYIAIRRGPMKTPTSGASVFNAVTATGSTSTFRNIGFPLDMTWATSRGGDAWRVQDRIRGLPTSANSGNILLTTATNAEASIQPSIYNADNLGYYDGASLATLSGIWHHFRRAPGFFDVVAYTGDGSAFERNISHNLGVTPEMLIVKRRDSTSSWPVYHQYAPGASAPNYYALLNATNNYATSLGGFPWGAFFPVSFSATTFRVNGSGTVNAVNTNISGASYIAYLFASCPGVSKVGFYTGTGTTLQINCGFTNGSRFVLIKRTDASGDWYVWDTARGIVSGNDSYLLLNSTAAEITNTDYINPLSSGFQINSTAPAAINANGGSFIYLAVA